MTYTSKAPFRNIRDHCAAARVVLLVLVGLGFSGGVVQAQDWATKMFPTTHHDFGPVARGAKIQYEFEFENLYGVPVRVHSVRSSCGCTTPQITKRDLQPLEKSQIVAVYNTRTFLGQKGATITVVFDQPYYAEVQLTVNGYIRSDVVFVPGEINFGEVDQGDSAERKVTVSYAGRDDWQIIDVTSASKSFVVDLADPTRGAGRVTYEMVVRVKPDAPAGYFQSQLTIVTDDHQRKRIPLMAQGRIVSPLTVSPASLFLGVVAPGQAVTKQLVVRGKKPFKVTKVACEDGCFEFKPPGGEPRMLHLIPVTFTASTNPGKVAETIYIESDLGASATCLATATVVE